MEDTITLHRPDPMEHEVLGPFLECLNDDARDSIVSNIKRRQDVIERLMEALIPVLEGLSDAGIPLVTNQLGNGGVVTEAMSLLTEIDAAMCSEGTVAVWNDLDGDGDSQMEELFWQFNWEMFSALNRFRLAKEPATL
jgi:hypothetical protein